MSSVAPVARGTGIPAEIHAALALWGSWRARGPSGGPAGYPRQSPFVRAAQYGALGIPQESNVRIDHDTPSEIVETVDKVVVAMPPHLARSLEIRYAGLAPRRGNEPLYAAMARVARVSPSTFRNRLESAQWYVYARMY